MKGDHNDECYRTTCKNKPANYYNHSTQKHYCTSCAHLINIHNFADGHRLFGHDLCTRVVDNDNPKLKSIIVNRLVNIDPSLNEKTEAILAAWIGKEASYDNLSQLSTEYEACVKGANAKVAWSEFNCTTGQLVLQVRHSSHKGYFP